MKGKKEKDKRGIKSRRAKERNVPIAEDYRRACVCRERLGSGTRLIK
jgi:hypothetical protein